MFWLVSLSCLGGVSLGLLVPQIRAVLCASLQIWLVFLALWGAGEVRFGHAVFGALAGVAAHQFGFFFAALIRFSLARRGASADPSATADAESLREIAARMRKTPEGPGDLGEVARSAERLRKGA